MGSCDEPHRDVATSYLLGMHGFGLNSTSPTRGDVGHPKGGQFAILVAEILQVLTPQLVHLQQGLAFQGVIVLRHSEGFSHFFNLRVDCA